MGIVLSWLKQQVWERDNWTCVYCGLYMKQSYDLWAWQMRYGREKGMPKIKRVNPNMITVDHKQPKSRGGLNTYENLLTSCFVCNCLKGSKSYDEFILEIKCGLHGAQRQEYQRTRVALPPTITQPSLPLPVKIPKEKRVFKEDPFFDTIEF